MPSDLVPPAVEAEVEAALDAYERDLRAALAESTRVDAFDPEQLGRPQHRHADGDLPGHPFRGNQYREGEGAGASGPGAPPPFPERPVVPPAPKWVENEVAVFPESFGISRKDMPQIRPPLIPEFVAGLEADGIRVERGMTAVGLLKPTQKNIDVEKARGMLAMPEAALAKPIVISADGYILDGHHRWAALYMTDPTKQIETVKVDLPMKDLLPRALRFEKVSFKTGKGDALEEYLFALEWSERTDGDTPGHPFRGNQWTEGVGGAGEKVHPQKGELGEPVIIHHPTPPSDPSTWKDPRAVATFVPDGETPDALNGVALSHAAPPADWAKLPTDPRFDQPLDAEGWRIGAGVVVQEPDGRVWLTVPSNAFGGYQQSYPKGTPGLGESLQQAAMREAWEESGLRVEITGILGDYRGDTSVSRYFLAKRVGGTPADMGWETQAMRLAPPEKAVALLNRPRDQQVLADLLARRRREDFDPNQPRDEKGWWTSTGGNALDASHRLAYNRNSSEWGATHAGSQSVTFHAAQLMGIPGYNKPFDESEVPEGARREYVNANKRHEGVARLFLQHIADSAGSPHPLYHVFEDTEHVKWKVGDTFKIPTTASAGERNDSYGMRSDVENQIGTPTVFEFPPGTPMAGYSKWNASEAKEFGHVWTEAIVAGEFRVVGVRKEQTSLYQHDNKKHTADHPTFTIVRLEPVRVFDPDSGKWRKARHG